MDGIDIDALGPGKAKLGRPATATTRKLGAWLLSPRVVSGILLWLIVLDVGLTTCAMAFPDAWFQLMYGIPYAGNDPACLLFRTGAMWFAFTLVQVVALWRWQRSPYLLVLVAGVRCTELFADWTTLAVATVTPLARAALITPPLTNAVLVVLLVAKYHQLQAHALRKGVALAP
jgi:hypothetical protein